MLPCLPIAQCAGIPLAGAWRDPALATGLRSAPPRGKGLSPTKRVVQRMGAGQPHVGFSAAIRRTRARISAVVLGRPARGRDFQRQYRPNPSPCQQMTVSGWTMASVLALEDSELLVEREVLQDQVGPVGEDREESPGDGQSVVEHPRTMTAVGTEGNRARPRALRVSRTGTHPVEEQGGRGYGEAQPRFTVRRAISPPASSRRTGARPRRGSGVPGLGSTGPVCRWELGPPGRLRSRTHLRPPVSRPSSPGATLSA
jgi:hypothetical protein